MTLQKKIEKLNTLNRNSLGIDYFFDGWQLSAYQNNAPLNMDNYYPYIHGTNLEELIDQGLEVSLKGIKKGKEYDTHR